MRNICLRIYVINDAANIEGRRATEDSVGREGRMTVFQEAMKLVVGTPQNCKLRVIIEKIRELVEEKCVPLPKFLVVIFLNPRTC